jgi:hypothetical protein
VFPLSTLLFDRTSDLPGVESSHTTHTLDPDRAICGSEDSPRFLLKLTVGFQVAPLSVVRLYMISPLPGLSSLHTTCRLEPDAAICERREQTSLLCDR